MKPIMFDRVIHKIKQVGSLPHVVTGGFKPVPFVVDPTTVEIARGLPHLPDIIALAIPPYPETWLEFSVGQFHVGALLKNTEKLIGISMFEEQHGHLYAPLTFLVARDEQNINCGFIHRIRTPVEIDTVAEDLNDHWKRCAILVSHAHEGKLPKWSNHIAVALFNRGDPKQDIDIAQLYLERRHAVLTILLGILALIAHAPVKRTVMSPSGRWVDTKRHTTRPFASHTVVRVEVTPKLIYRSLRNAATGLKKRLHDVRSHPRVIRRGRPDEYTVVVRSHERGDASLGRVIHDAYETVRIDRRMGD